MKRKTNSRQGAVLLTVVIVSMMMMVIISAAISFVGHTNRRSHEEYRKKQAYFTASSCIESFVEVTTNTNTSMGSSQAEIEANIKMLQDIADGKKYSIDIMKNGTRGGYAGEVTDYFTRGVGTCTIKVEKINGSSNNLKATAIAEYAGEKQTVAAYLYIKPLLSPGTMDNALEIIGTDGGGQSYNNLRVFGNTATPDLDSHYAHTLYVTGTNANTFCGDKLIYGSLASTFTGYSVLDNPYDETGEKPGCTLTVSRSLFVANRFTMASNREKTMDYEGNYSDPDYNYLNVGEAILFSGESSSKVGTSPSNMVDIYASGIYIGPKSGVPAKFKTAILDGIIDSDLLTSYNNNGFEKLEHGESMTFYSNIYTYPDVSGLDGDIYITGQSNHFYGDIYCGGDIYFNSSDPNNYHNIKLYISDASHVHGSIPAGVTAVYGDWTTKNVRCVRPSIDLTTPNPYVYYPEHFLCSDGVSTIKNTYASFYEGGYGTTLKTSGVKVLSGLSDDFRTDYTYTADNGKSITANYYVTESCILGDFYGNANIIIDARAAQRNADGRNDIVVIMKNGLSWSNNNNIFVINDTDESDGEDERFVYFVSDAGVGDTDASSTTSENTYDHSTFRSEVIITFGGTQKHIMDADAYLHSNLNVSGAYINPTDKDYPGAYDLKHSQIIFLLTEGTKFIASGSTDNLLIQGAIYGPRAEVNLSGNRNIMLAPPCSIPEGPDNSRVTVIGMVLCHNFITDGNNTGISYQPTSKNSMLPKAKGSKDIAESGFDIDHYAHS